MQFADRDEDEPLAPSKSARKREALARQKLGQRLAKLKDADLATLELPEALRDALLDARRITAHGALARQFQYVGRLMRDIDVEALEKQLALLPGQHGQSMNPHARMRR
jgi:ribosome-associated protein